MAVKDLDGVLGALHRPVVDGGVGDESNDVVVDPAPESDVLGEGCGLDFCLGLEVEDLECFSGGGLEGNDLSDGVHNGRVGRDGAAECVCGVSKVDNSNL